MAVVCPWCGESSIDPSLCEWCKRLIKPLRDPPDDDDQADDVDDEFVYMDPLVIRMEYFLATAFLSLAVIIALGGFGALSDYAAVSLGSFLVCFWLSVYQMVPSIDHMWAPAGMAAVLALVFGPWLVAVLFFIICLAVRRHDARGVLILLIAHLLAAGVVAYACRPDFGVAARLAGWMPGTSDANLSLLAGMLGWTLANFWRPLNEEPLH